MTERRAGRRTGQYPPLQNEKLRGDLPITRDEINALVARVAALEAEVTRLRAHVAGTRTRIVVPPPLPPPASAPPPASRTPTRKSFVDVTEVAELVDESASPSAARPPTSTPRGPRRR